MLKIFLGACAAAFILVALPASADTAASACAPDRVTAVETANLEFRTGEIVVSAEGSVPTAGWKNASLRLLAVSADGATAVFEFVACPPAGFAAEVISNVSAKTEMTENLKSIRRVVVKARSNEQTLDVADFRKPVSPYEPVP